MGGLKEVHILTKILKKNASLSVFWILNGLNAFEFLPLPLCSYLIEVKISNFLRSTILSICLRLPPAFGMVRGV